MYLDTSITIFGIKNGCHLLSYGVFVKVVLKLKMVTWQSIEFHRVVLSTNALSI